MRPSPSKFSNPTGELDAKLSGTSDLLEGISQALPQIKHLSYYLESLFNLDRNLTLLTDENVDHHILKDITIFQGASAYEIALDQGFVGTSIEWLDSLVGADGADGETGIPNGTLDFDVLTPNSALTNKLFVGSEKRTYLDGQSDVIVVQDSEDNALVQMGKLAEGKYGLRLFNANGTLIFDSSDLGNEFSAFTTRIQELESELANLTATYGSTSAAAASAAAALASAQAAANSETNSALALSNAEKAQAQAEAAVTAANAAQVLAGNYTAEAQAAEANAAQAYADSEDARIAAEAAKALAENAKSAAETAEANSEAALQNTNNALQDAQDARDAAEDAKTNALTSANNAATSASAAGSMATTAAGSATVASQHADDAGSSASIAQAAVITAEAHRDDAEDHAASAQAYEASAATASQDATSAAATATQQKELATTAATNAENSASAAATSEMTAASHATDAGQSASAANVERLAAETARSGAETAESSAVSAKNGAESASATASTQAGLAATSATDSENSATASSSSATTAESHATDAAQSASVADTSRIDAETAEASAVVARNDAVTAKQDAEGASAEATTQAGLAAQSETNAGNSAFAAAGSASTAASEATEAAQSATAAEASALSANTSESNAAASKSLAVSAKNDAETAAASAAESSDLSTEVAKFSVPSNLADDGFFITSNGVEVSFPEIVDSVIGRAGHITNSASGVAGISIFSKKRYEYVPGKVFHVETIIKKVAERVTADVSGQNTNVGDVWYSVLFENADGSYNTRRLIAQGNIAEASPYEHSAELDIDTLHANDGGTGVAFHIGINLLRDNDGELAVSRLFHYDKSSEFAADVAATASATSASSAAASETAAVQSASAAETNRLAAETAQSNAEIAETNAVTAKNNAESAFSGATTQAGIATSAATDAGNSASAAAGSASTAESHATDAGQSASSATAAQNAAETAEADALAYKNQAATSETNAAGSASAAASSQGLAASAASNAENSADAAATSATSAAASETAAGQSASASDVSRLAAETAESNASSSETAAALSETNAAGNASSASTSATNAANSENAAEQSASAAATSASTASTEASDAATSATAAQTSQLAAASSAGEALTYRNDAATSATNAAGSASSASQSESIVAEVKNSVVAITGDPYLLSADTSFNISAIGTTTLVSDPKYKGGRALRTRTDAITNHASKFTIPVSTDKTYRFEMGFWLEEKPSSETISYMGVQCLGADGNTVGPNNGRRYIINSTYLLSTFAEGQYISAIETWGVGEDAQLNAGTVAVRLLLYTGYNSNDFITLDFDHFEITDVTSETNANNSAAAAATSATTAAASETAASQSATAANTDRLAAETARSGAETAETNSVTAENNAAGSASTATTQAGLATTAKTNANNSATAASGSATQASSFADDAEQSAITAAAEVILAETARSGAEAAKSAAVTAKNDAESAEAGASQSETLAANSETAAGNSAVAAAGSASSASSFADDAQQFSQAAEAEKLAAQTARGGAEAAETAAVTAKNDAETAEAAASQSATLSAEVKNSVVAITGDPYLVDSINSFNISAIGTTTLVSDPKYKGGKALRTRTNAVTPHNSKFILPVSTDKTYRFETGFWLEEKPAGETFVYMGIQCLGADGNTVGPNNGRLYTQRRRLSTFTEGQYISAIETRGVGGDRELNAGTVAVRLLLYTGFEGTADFSAVDFDHFEITDVTSEINASNSASAAAASESTASAHKDAAGASALAANASEIAASTSEANAGISETNAATSETNAAGSAAGASSSASAAATSAITADSHRAAAGVSETNAASSASDASGFAAEASASALVAASSAAQGGLVLNSMFSDWEPGKGLPNSYSFWSSGAYASRETSDRYFPGIDTIKLAYTTADASGFKVTSYEKGGNGNYNGINGPLELGTHAVVSARVKLLSGSWSGSGIFINFRAGTSSTNSGSSASNEAVLFSAAGAGTGKWVTISKLVPVPATADGVILYGKGNYNGDVFDALANKEILFATLDIRRATEEEIEALKVVDVEAAISTESAARVSGDAANAAAITTVSSRVDNVEADASILMDAFTDANGDAHASIALVAAASGGTPATIELRSGDGTSGIRLGGNTQIDGNLVVTGTIQSAGIADGAITTAESDQDFTNRDMTDGVWLEVSSFDFTSVGIGVEIRASGLLRNSGFSGGAGLMYARLKRGVTVLRESPVGRAYEENVITTDPYIAEHIYTGAYLLDYNDLPASGTHTYKVEVKIVGSTFDTATGVLRCEESYLSGREFKK